jgi:hypothetical protein
LEKSPRADGESSPLPILSTSALAPKEEFVRAKVNEHQKHNSRKIVRAAESNTQKHKKRYEKTKEQRRSNTREDAGAGANHE